MYKRKPSVYVAIGSDYFCKLEDGSLATDTATAGLIA
jgi:hypothetical protein